MVSPLRNVPSATSDLARKFEGAADHLAGRTDEATSGVVSGLRNGRYFMAGKRNAGALDHLAGRVDEAMASGPVDTAVDVTFEGHAGDTANVWGPTFGQAADPLVHRKGESKKGEWKMKLLLGGMALLGASILFRPYAEVGAAAATSDGGDS